MTNSNIPDSPFSGVNQWLRELDGAGGWYDRNWSYSHVLTDYENLWATSTIYLYEGEDMVASFVVKFDNEQPIDILHADVEWACRCYWAAMFNKAQLKYLRYPMSDEEREFVGGN